MPIEGEHLVVHPSYPFASILNRRPDDDTPEYPKVRNRWYCSKLDAHVAICEVEPGTIRIAVVHRNRIEMELRTMGLYPVWGVEQEARAIQLLGGLVTHAQFRSYMLTGRLMEQSRRSQLFYMFNASGVRLWASYFGGTSYESLHGVTAARSWRRCACIRSDITKARLQVPCARPMR